MNAVRNAPCNAVTYGVTGNVRYGVRCWVQNQNQNQTVLKQFGGCSWSMSKSIIKAVTRDIRSDDDSLLRDPKNETSA